MNRPAPHSRPLSNPEPIDIGGDGWFHGDFVSSGAAVASPRKGAPPMSHLALVSPTFRTTAPPAAQWAHDIRNTLTTVGLHLDTLERLAGSAGHKPVEAAHALMLRATTMCEQALAQAGEPRRRTIEAVAAVRQVVDVIAPIAPAGFAVRVHGDGAFPVLADADHLFRILFNLLHNAVSVARDRRTLRNVDVAVARTDGTIVVRVADDGPGLPASVRKQLFRAGVASNKGSGFGLSIARELAEKSGGTLRLAPSAKGVTFVLELPAAATLAVAKEGPVTRSLGHRAA
jgi:signal transduction histidine kinase